MLRIIAALLLLLLPYWVVCKERKDTDHLSAGASVDRLSNFYKTLKQSTSAKYCADRTKLMPECTACIPGLRVGASDQEGESSSAPCTDYMQESKLIRDELRTLTKQRYPDLAKDEARAYGLYPYLETPEFVRRQDIFGEMISTKYKASAANIIDIGAYYNPVHLFFRAGYCPASVIVVEPILDALSVVVPCEGSGSVTTHYLFLPVTMRFYVQVKDRLPVKPDTVVCIGCDGHYGPSKAMLETAFARPYTLFLEYPSEYIHNKAFKKIAGTGEGEDMVFTKKFQYSTNATQYTRRIMKVVEYK